MYLYDHLVRSSSGLIGDSSTGEDAWTAIEKKAKEKNYDTSKQSIDDYAAVGGGVAGAAACTVAGGGAGAIAAPLCAEIGGIIGSAVADMVQNFGAALFGGTKLPPGPGNLFNPPAAKAVTGIVKVWRVKKGLEVSQPPGGSFRNYPEWPLVAQLWSDHVNDFLLANGSPVRWFNDGVGKVDQAEIKNGDSKSGQLLVNIGVPVPQAKDGPFDYCVHNSVASSFCDSIIDVWHNKNSVMSKAMVQATQQTTADVLAPPGSRSGGFFSSSSTTSTVVKVGAVAGAGALLWYFHQPIFAFVSGLLKR